MRIPPLETLPQQPPYTFATTQTEYYLTFEPCNTALCSFPLPMYLTLCKSSPADWPVKPMRDARRLNSTLPEEETYAGVVGDIVDRARWTKLTQATSRSCTVKGSSIPTRNS